MNRIKVEGPVAAAIHSGQDILNSLKTGEPSHLEGKSVRLPVWGADGVEVKSVAQVGRLLGVTDEQAARHIVESKSAGVELFNDALSVLESKVRNVINSDYWNLPVGTPIVGRSGKGGTALTNLKVVKRKKSDYKGSTPVEGSDGKRYHVMPDPDNDKNWVATSDDGDFWDGAIEAPSEEAVYKALNKKLGGQTASGASAQNAEKAPNKPASSPLLLPLSPRSQKDYDTLNASGKKAYDDYRAEQPRAAHRDLMQWANKTPRQRSEITRSNDAQHRHQDRMRNMTPSQMRAYANAGAARDARNREARSKIKKTKGEQADYDALPNAKAKKFYDDAIMDGKAHNETINSAWVESLTPAQYESVFSMDTIVRDWYFDERRDGKGHAEALKVAKRMDDDSEGMSARKKPVGNRTPNTPAAPFKMSDMTTSERDTYNEWDGYDKKEYVKYRKEGMSHNEARNMVVHGDTQGAANRDRNGNHKKPPVKRAAGN